MSRTVREHTGTFTAHSKDGREFTIFIYTTYHEGRTSEGPYRKEGIRDLKTSDGQDVTCIGAPTEKGKYRIIDVEELDIFSDDSNAP